MTQQFRDQPVEIFSKETYNLNKQNLFGNKAEDSWEFTKKIRINDNLSIW
jgi:hypothetical protein